MAGRILLSVLLAVTIAVWMAPDRAAAWSPAVREVFPAGLEEAGSGIRPPGRPGRVVIVSVDYLQIKDLEEGLPPRLSGLFAGGAVALMNVNTGGSVTPENTHATIGSGSHAVAPASSPGGFGAGERLAGGTAAEEFRLRTGRTPPEGSLVYLDIARAHSMNKKLHHPVVPGALGKIVREAGCRTAALGNSDGPRGPKRKVVSMVMDEWGMVDTGSVGEDVVMPEKGFPGGLVTDYGAILEKFTTLPPDVRLAAVELGDLSRLQEAREYMTGDQWQAWRKKTILRMDSFLGSLVDRMDTEKDLLVLISPTPGDDGEKRDRMSPVLMFGAGAGKGLLVSPATRRPGIIMNTDIAPTVLNFLGIPVPDLFTGRPARVIKGTFDTGELTGMFRVLELTYEARPYLQKGYVLFQIVLLAASVGFIFLRKRGKEILKPFFLAVMAVPLAYLLIPLLPVGGIPVYAVELLAVTSAITVIAIVLHKKRGVDPFLLICLSTAAAITVDLAAGSPLQKASVMGFDPIVGARFYGLGNEYMGVLIGSSLVGTTALITAAEKRRRVAVAVTGVFYLAILVLIAAPQAGANAGGTIAAAAAFLVTFLLVCGVRFTATLFLAAAAGVALLVAALAAYDAGRADGWQSHIGRTTALISAGGLDQLAGIIVRKSEMNIKLFRYTVWSRVLLASLGILALLFYRPAGVMEGIKNRYPYLFMGLAGVVAGSLAAFVFNDSGVVAAATVMIFGAPPLIYLVLEQLEA
ncbi:MAG: hypothetical protein K6T66_05245 [Peptococcaceae bacterium]|nr:hypothetical protein [Peptococcaceae bacterium]